MCVGELYALGEVRLALECACYALSRRYVWFQNPFATR